jgi:hypothetical protein
MLITVGIKTYLGIGESISNSLSTKLMTTCVFDYLHSIQTRVFFTCDSK